MKKASKASLSVIAVTTIGLSVGIQNVHGEEIKKSDPGSAQDQETNTSKQSLQNDVSEKQSQVASKQSTLDQKQQVAAKAKTAKESAEQAVNEQQTIVNQDKATLDEEQKQVSEKKSAVDEAKKVVDEATPTNINQTKNQIATDTKTVNDQQNIVDTNEQAVNDQQNVVDQKEQAVEKQQTVNNQDKEAVASANKELEKTQQLADNAQVEKANTEKEKTQNESDVAKKVVDETIAQTQVNKDQQNVEKQRQNVSNSENQVEVAKVDSEAKQKDLENKETALEAKQSATKEASKNLENSEDELKSFKGINLPGNFTPDYYKKLNEQEKNSLEKEGLASNSDFPTSKIDESNKSIMIDVKNPSDEQKQLLSDFGVGILNDVREKMGLSKLKVSNQAINFAWDVAKYSDPKRYMHDENAINQSAKENGFKEYPGQNFYEDLGIGQFQVNNGKVSLYDVEKSIRDVLIGMILHDGEVYGHLDSLMNPDTVNMAFAISGEGYSGKTHIISFKKDRLLDPSTYEEGVVPEFKSKETIEKEISENQNKLATAKDDEAKAIVDRDTSKNALDQAKSVQTNAEKSLSSEQAKLSKLNTILDKDTTILQQKKEATSKAKDKLADTQEKLAKIQALIDNREEVLKGLKTNLDEAKKTEAISADILRSLISDETTEKNKLDELTNNLNQSKTKLSQLENKLDSSKKKLERLINAQPNYLQAVKNLNVEKEKLIIAQKNYDESIEKLAQLEAEKEKATSNYDQANKELINARTALNTASNRLNSAKAKLKTEQERIELVKYIDSEKRRLDNDTQNKQYVVGLHQVATSLNTQPKSDQPKEILEVNTPVKSDHLEIANKDSKLPKTTEISRSNEFSLLGVFVTLLGLLGVSYKRKQRN